MKNCNYERIKKKIEESNYKKIVCCYPATVMGPTGPAGASDTITIRNTITGEAGTNAEVREMSGSPNHILDFVIPRGNEGPTGPTGLQGEMGPTGPTGPTGPEGSISSNTYAMAHSEINRTINNEGMFPFEVSDRISNMMVGLNGTITLAVEGTYLVNWSLTINNLGADSSVLSVELRETSPTPRTLGWSTSGKEVATTETAVLTGSALIDSHEVTRNFALINTSNVDVFLNPNLNVGGVLTVIKIN